MTPMPCNAMKECQVANFHGQTSDASQFIFMDKTLKPMSYTDSLFSWKTSRHLYHVMKECQVANFHMQTVDPYAYA